MESIASFFITNKRFTFAFTFLVVAAGYMSLSTQKAETFPNVNIGQVIITTAYRGASIEDIESKITKPIEDELRSVSGIKDVRSVSQPGVSTVFTVVDVDRYDVEEVISDIQRAVDRVSDLPSDLENPPSFIEIKTDEFPVIEVAVTGPGTSYERNKVAHELSETLSDNKKISSTNRVGYSDPQFNIELDLAKMSKEYISPQEVIAAVGTTTVSVPAGNIENSKEKFLLKVDGKIKTVEKLKRVSVRSSHSGNAILLEDIAKVTLNEKERKKDALFNGEMSTNLSIAKKGGEDIGVLSEEIKVILKDFRGKYPEYSFEIYSDEGLRVGNRLSVLYSNAVVGLLLVVGFLLLFLSGYIGLVTALSLPLAVLGTLTYMSAAGLTLNSITIMALIISIGMLVDNSVVIAENFKRLLAEGYPREKAALESISSLWVPITATAMTTIAAFLPMLVTKGIIGQFIIGIPLIVTASLILSLVESFFLLPMRLVMSVKKEGSKAALPDADWFQMYLGRPFQRFIKTAIRFRYITLGSLILLLGFSFYLMAEKNQFILFPANQTEIYLARLELKNGTPLDVTSRRLGEFTGKVKEVLGDDLKSIAAVSGDSKKDPPDPKGLVSESVGILRIFMTDKAKNSLVTANVLKRLRTITMEDVKRISFEAEANGPPVGDPLTVRLRSSVDSELEEVTQKLYEKVAGLEGIQDLRVNQQFSEPEVQVLVDTIKAQSLGVQLSDVGRTFQVGFSGVEVNDVNLNNREVDYFVKLRPEDRQNVEALKNMYVPNQFGKLISISKFATIKVAEAIPFVDRFDYKRTKTITANVDTAILTSVEANAFAKQEFDKLAPGYPSVSLLFGGEAERTAESMESLQNATNLAFLGIFVLLILVFNSFSRPLLVLSTIPLGLVGVSIAFFLQSLPISFLALIGVVGLSGIIVNSGIVLISFIEELKEKEPHKPIMQVLIESSVLRLRAVMITSLTTISGLIPTAYGIGGSDEFIRPMAMSISWGLVSGTLLTLIWVPCLYMVFQDVGWLFHRALSDLKDESKNEMSTKPALT